MSNQATKLEMATAVAAAALNAIAGRIANRDCLAEGANHAVELKITGKVDGVPVEFSKCGILSVGNDNPSGTTKRPKLDRMLATAFDIMAKTRRERLVAAWNDDGIHEPTPEAQQLVAALIQNHSQTSNKRGAVSFQEAV